jgi:hyperosmotically inducible periplasmic protein
VDIIRRAERAQLPAILFGYSGLPRRGEMNKKEIEMKKTSRGLASVLAAVLVLGSQVLISPAPYALGQNAQTDNNIQADLQNSFKKFKGVQVSVKNGVVDLEGTVNDFATSEELDKKAHRTKNVVAVRNKLKIAGAGEMSDAQLQQAIVKKLQYDRVGYGNAFNAISVNVQNGVVTLGGNALGPVAADSAVSLASHFRGVQDVINNISVDPLSPMDDRSRLQVYRAIYGYPSLNRYALDPAQPIRITVVNGNVTLNGVVNSQADKNVAGIRANSVPGIFKVTNNLQVANPSNEK